MRYIRENGMAAVTRPWQAKDATGMQWLTLRPGGPGHTSGPYVAPEVCLYFALGGVRRMVEARVGRPG